jgi:hypothetical protein
MRKIFIFLSLIGLLLSVNRNSLADGNFFDVPVRDVEVKDLGLSDRDESKSVIEVRWNVAPVQREKIVSYSLTLSITYADGSVISEKRKVGREAVSTRIEVPSVKTFGGRATAFIKKIDARVFAVISKI